jgi:ADP-heptose:LPS heptosyltransferase
MIGYIVTGGIGDAILSLPIIEKLKVFFNDEIVILCFDINCVPLLFYTKNQVKCHNVKKIFSTNEVYSFLQECSIVVWNRFESDNDGLNNYFYAIDDSKIDIIRRFRETYHKNLSKSLGREILDLRKEDKLSLLTFLSSEENYYADWNRFGIDVSYDDLKIDIPQNTIDKNEKNVKNLGSYCIVHDSRLYSSTQNIKSWYFDRWQSATDFILKNFGMKVVQFHDREQLLFNGAISHTDVICPEAQFFDYLYLLSKSKFYVGTDSWPGHAAICFPEVKFILLKGAVAKRWDHFRRYSSIIRKGKCQACEYISLDECVFCRGKKECMNKIEVDDVLNEIKKIVSDKGIRK